MLGFQTFQLNFAMITVLSLISIAAVTSLRDGITISELADGDCTQGVASHGDRVSLMYVGYDGAEPSENAVFHKTSRHTPFTFILGEDEVLSAFSEGTLNACVASKRRITLDKSVTANPPVNVVNGKMRDYDVPFGKTMTFDIEIVSVVMRDVVNGVDRMMQKLRNRNNVTREEFEFAVKKAKGFPLDYIDVDSRTFLITAAFTGNFEVVEYLLDNKVDPNQAMKTGLSALMYAAGEGHERCVVSLLNANASTSLSLHGGALGGYTALHFAALTGRTKMVEALLKAGADPKAMSHQGKTPWDIAKALATNGKHAGIKRGDRMRCKRNLKELKALFKKYEGGESSEVGKSDL